MNKRLLISVVFLLLSLVVFTGCDPVYPSGKLKVEQIGPLSQGVSVDIKIIYPNTGGSIVLGWKNQNVEIIDGNEIVAIDGLTVTGLKPGTARIKVSATTVISEESAAAGRKEKVYSAEINVEVE